ncbi:MAG: GNAT family N-acetyltransferase [Rhizobiales bacterium]|nr:GNAT family N-acetyltransferase [Hyphomicrobiales bacterium]
MWQLSRLVAVIFHEQSNLEMAAAFFRFRKALFVDECGWDLPVCSDAETDQFDTSDTVYCALLADDAVVGGFRAICCDKPYLARDAFPHLATTRPYPERPDYWEISRFGVRRRHRKYGVMLYAVMFHFAEMRRAKALVAVADISHERLLGKIGIRTRRYGPPIVLGDPSMSEPIQIVAGEIPLAEQERTRLQFLRTCSESMEIRDDTLVWRPVRVSA